MKSENYLKEFRILRSALENKKLVIFVGAGVSANSLLPTWSELVKKFADQIGYFSGLSKKEIENYKLSSDEYIKIPQYAFDKNKTNYFETIKDSLNIPAKSNSINEKILSLLPNHIVTTNYDKLIEQSEDLNVSQYKVVSSDKELLVNQGEHYIIKMHGNIDNLQEIILKEDDYLNYSNTHVLIETFIKSLLVNHTFLFVGYSLNDYNLKQIMSWVDYLSNKEDVKNNRHKNYIIQNFKPKNYEIEYWKSKNLSVIDSSSLDESLISKYEQDDLIGDVGRRLYACLEIINNEKNDIFLINYEEYLLEKYKVFGSLEFIYINDLLKVSDVNNVKYESGILSFYDDQLYEKWVSVSQNASISNYWQKSGIEGLRNLKDDEKTIVMIPDNRESYVDYLFELSLQFKYKQINKELRNNDIKDKTKYYYKSLIELNSCIVVNFYSMMSISKESQFDNIYVLIQKFNKFLSEKMNYQSNASKKEVIRYAEMLSKQEKNAISYLYSIIESGQDLGKVNHNRKLLEQTEKSYNKPPIFTTDLYGKMPDIRSNVYQHLLFIRKNGIILDYFDDTANFFEDFIKSILITHKNKRIGQESLFEKDMSVKKYPLTLLDINILVTFGNFKSMKEYIVKEEINSITFSDHVNLEILFKDFCDSINVTLKKGNNRFMNKFKNFSFLLRNSSIKAELITKLGPIVSGLLKTPAFVSEINSASNLELTNEFFAFLKLIFLRSEILPTELMVTLIKKTSVKQYTNSLFLSIINYLSNEKTMESDRRIQLAITAKLKSIEDLSEKVRIAGILFPIMSKNLKKKNLSLIEENQEYLYLDSLIYLISNKFIRYNKIIEEKYIKQVNSAIEKKSKGIQSYPDPLERTIESILILHLTGVIKDIVLLEKYIQHSNYISFMIEPIVFDYSLIDFADYMWGNIFRNENYRKLILKYGKEEIERSIKEKFESGIVDLESKKIFYKYFASEKDFWNYD